MRRVVLESMGTYAMGLVRALSRAGLDVRVVDPKRIRMPVANDLHGSWSWDHRIDITTWAEDKVITSAGAATMSDDPAKGQEGWLRLTPLPEEKQ